MHKLHRLPDDAPVFRREYPEPSGVRVAAERHSFLACHLLSRHPVSQHHSLHTGDLTLIVFAPRPAFYIYCSAKRVKLPCYRLEDSRLSCTVRTYQGSDLAPSYLYLNAADNDLLLVSRVEGAGAYHCARCSAIHIVVRISHFL